MADGETEDLILNEDMEIEAGEEQQVAAPEGDDDDVVIELEGDEPEDETPLVKRLRAELRDRERKLAENRPQEQEIVVGEKPTLENCEYDEERFDVAYQEWLDRKAAADRQQQSRQTVEQLRAAEYRDLEIRYRASAAKLPVRQEVFDEADAAVRQALPEAIQVAIAKYMDDPAKVVLALGKHPARLAAIADEPDPVKQLFMIRDLQGAIKVTRRSAPAPEADTIQRGSASMSASSDKHLAKLEQEAARTGDRSKLIAYKAEKQKKAA